MYDAKSRYAGLTPYEVTDRRGRTVTVVPPPNAPDTGLLGYHQRSQEERIDHLAYRYLDDPAGFWHLCEQNDVMLPVALSETRRIAIPQRRR